jgi:hypothetical protein
MADSRTILADQCARWIINTTKSQSIQNMKLLNSLRCKPQLSEEEKQECDQLVKSLIFSVPDLSLDEAVVDDYQDYWLQLLEEALNKITDSYTLSALEPQVKEKLFSKFKAKPILLNLEFINDAKHHEVRTIMLKSSIKGIQYIKQI